VCFDAVAIKAKRKGHREAFDTVRGKCRDDCGGRDAALCIHRERVAHCTSSDKG